MQAPTAPSGPPVQEPGERACAGCGAENGASAAFCWQCYRPFAAVPAAPAGALPAGPISAGAGGWPPLGAPAPYASPPTAPAPSRGGFATMAVVALGTVAVIAAAWFVFMRKDAVAMPDAFAGMPRIDNEQTELVAKTFQTELDTTGVEGDLVIYGNGMPSAALIWIRDASVPTTADAFDEFAAGFNQGIGASGSLGKEQTDVVGGVTFVCAPVLGSTPGTICMWQEREVFWLLFDFSGGTFGEGQSLAGDAYEAVAAF